MEIVSVPFPLRFIIALPVWLAFGFLISYCQKPEDFLIKRLRPKGDTRFTHSQLLFRALAGAVLFALLLTLGVGIITSDEAFLEWRSHYAIFNIFTGLYLGISLYLYFRLWRYRKLTPAEQPASDPRPLFARRTEPNPKTWLLRGGLIALFIFMGFIPFQFDCAISLSIRLRTVIPHESGNPSSLAPQNMVTSQWIGITGIPLLLLLLFVATG